MGVATETCPVRRLQVVIVDCIVQLLVERLVCSLGMGQFGFNPRVAINTPDRYRGMFLVACSIP